MKLRYAFKRTIANKSAGADKELKPEVPDGMLKKCNACKAAVFVDEVKKNAYICPHCGNYFRVHARRRIEMLADEGTFEEWDKVMPISNPLSYKGYEEKVKKLQEKTNLDEAIVTGKAKIGGISVVLGVCDSRFLMASMGENVGEKIARAVERATQERLPVVLFACSGGARMQEGIVSLMQMAKTSAALKRHSDSGLYISVLTNPTTGGVTASFAMLGDIILAEPGALIGFAGPRVIEQTIRQKLPKGFQSSEFLLEHGFIDQIAERKNMKETLARLLKMHCKNDCAESLEGQENALFCALVDRQLRNVLAVKDDLAGRDRILRIAGDRIAERGFAGAVRPHEHVRLVFADGQIHTVQDLLVACAHVQATDFKQVAVHICVLRSQWQTAPGGTAA